MSKILELNDVSFGYNKNKIINNVSFTMEAGEFLALVGENGAGKSTLIKLIAGELKPDFGEIIYYNDQKIGYVPQLSAAISNNFPITVREILALNLNNKSSEIKISKENKAKKIEMILSLIGMKGRENTLFGDLSGGQKQKTMLGKALISNPQILLLDEPLIGIDEESRISFLNLLSHQCTHHGITVLIITHDFNEIESYADRILVVKNGKVEENVRTA